MIKNTFIVTSSLIASAALGFLSQILFAAKFGASEAMDLHFRIVAIPSMVTGASSVIFTSLFIPLFPKVKSNINEYHEYINSTWLVIFITGLLFMVVSMLVSVSYIGGKSEKVTSGQLQLVFYVSLLISIGAGFSLMSGYMSAVLNYERRFLEVAWTSVLPALLTIICVILFHSKIGVLSISLGYAIGFFLQFVVLLSACKLSLRIDKISLNRIPDQIGVLKQSIFVFLALLPFSVTAPIAYHWAADIEAGSVSYIGYSLAFSGVLSVVVSMGISTVAFPELADNLSKDREESSLLHFQQTIRYLLMLAMFFAGMIVALRVEVLTVFYSRGLFKPESVENLSELIIWFLVSAVFIAGLNLLRNLLFARRANLKLAALGVAFTITYFVLAGVLKELFSLAGIGMANLLCYALLFVLTAHIARNKIPTFLGLNLYGFMGKSALAASIPCLIIFYSLEFLHFHFAQFASILIGVGLYSALYLFVAKAILNLGEVEVLTRIIYRHLKSLLNFK
jgi:putative peptidoglycan lipid II flippase